MMLAKTTEGDVFFTFRHESAANGYWVDDRGHRSNHVTECRIHIGKCIYYGSAWCSVDDQFCKDSGRKIALTRALKASHLNKASRRAVWDRYFDRGQPQGRHWAFAEPEAAL